MKIIVYKHHYGTSYFDASSDKKMKAAIKEIFKSNRSQSCYWNLENKNFKKEHSELTGTIKALEELDVNSLPVVLQQRATEERKRIADYKSEIKDLEYMKKLFDLAVAGDDKAAEKLLQFRRDYDSEGFVVEEAEDCAS